MRKKILFHAFIILTVAFVLGLVTGAVQGSGNIVQAKSWLIAHVTGILVSLIMAVVGLLWSDLRLGRRASRVLYWMTVHANYLVFFILGVLIPALNVAPALAVPEAVPPVGAAKLLMNTGILVATVSSFAMAILVLVGLRERSDSSI